MLGNILQGLGGGQGNLLPIILKVLQNQPGGLGGLLNSFQQKGMGDIVQSWISTGQNKPISAEQVSEALGPEQVSAVANEAGISHEEAKSSLASLLPQVVDRLTPNGQLPQSNDLMSQGMELLKGKLFG
ncbi:MAG TPA: YidB family protein [Terriglobales bacterium]|nr:YidB family protein [Terriglobales bacterium]